MRKNNQEWTTIQTINSKKHGDKTVPNKSYNQWRVMNKYKVLSSLLSSIRLDNGIFKSRLWS
jgi:hypothetical protein